MSGTSQVRKVTFQGFTGTRWQPPEDAELVIWCAECGEETDATTSDNPTWGEPIGVWCVQGAHETEVEV